MRLRTKIRVVVGFLAWLDSEQLALSDVRQGDLDRWLTERHLSAYELRFFIRWARKQDLVGNVRIPNPP